MTYTALKEKLHDLIETADQKKVKAVYALLATDPDAFIYDEATLAMLEKRSEDAFAGRSKTLTVEQSMERIKQSRKKHGV